MSVLINGMKMPKMCATCFAYVLEDDYCDILHKEVYYAERDSDCPLVEIPLHGRLIDQDAYRDEFMDGVYALCNDDPDNYRANAIIDLYDNAPTVIGEEEGEI